MVADDFKFNFLPAGNGAFNEDLTNEAVLEPLRADIVEFSIVVGNAAARTAQCIGRTHNERIADAVGKFLCRGNAFHNRALRNGLMEFFHRFFEEFAVLSLHDARDLGPNELHIVFFEDARLIKFDGKVKANLAA